MPSLLQFANNVASQLAANIGPSDTALLVTAGQGVRFPVISAGQYYYVTLVHFTTGVIEVVKVTSRAVDTLTIVRGQDGTTPTSFNTASIVELRVTSQVLREINWATNSNTANNPLVLDGTGLIADGFIPAGITRDTELAAGLAGKQDSLGFTPVRQGGGPGQLGNTVYIGWSGASKTKIAVDGFDQGNIAMEAWVSGAWLTSQRGVAGGLADLDGSGLVPIARIPALGYLPTAGGTVSGTLNVTGIITGSSAVRSSQNFESTVGAVVLAPGSAGTVYLRPNGVGSSSGELTLSTGGVATAVNFTGTSDRRLKKLIRKHVVREDLADMIALKTWLWKRTGEAGLGPIAQQVQDVAPEYVHRSDSGMLSVDKAGLAIEMAVGLAARLRRLEAASHV